MNHSATPIETLPMKKTTRHAITIVAALAFLPVVAFSQPPNPPSPPAPPAAPAPPNPPVAPDRREKPPKVPVTFLGVETSPVPPVVCEQLALAKGFGLVVDYVVPDSPAAAAGIQQNDILKMLNDQILTEPDQLSKLIRSYSEGTNITLTVLRKGQETKIPVKLTKKEVPQRRWFGRHEHDFDMSDEDFGALGETIREQMSELKERLRDSKQGVIHDAVMKAHEEVAKAREEALRAGQQARDEAQRARDEAQRERDRAHHERDDAQRARDEARRAGGQLKVTQTDESGLKTTRIDMGKAQIVLSDDKGELRMDCAEGKRILTAKDPKGMLLFSGPVATPGDIEKIPADVRARFEKLQDSDLPTLVGPDENDGDDEDADDSDEDEDEDAGPSVEQISIQTFPRNIWAYYTILI